MRAALAVDLESRDGSVTKDAKCKNAILEVVGEGDAAKLKMRKRPGLSDVGLINVGAAQALTYWNNQPVAITGDSINLGGSLGTYATWSSTDKGADVALTNANLTATIAGITDDAVRSTVSRSFGKWYWEITVAGNKTFTIGVANSSASLTSVIAGGAVNSLGVVHNGNIVTNGSNLVGGLVAFDVGDVISVALDMDARTVTFRKNNASATTISGASVPAGDLFAFLQGQNNIGGSSFTANFGATGTQIYPPPSGYTAGFYGLNSGFVPGASTALNPTLTGLPFSIQDNGANAPSKYLMLKNASQAWTVNYAGVVAQITDPDYPGTYTVTLTSLTRSGTVATATTAADTNFQVGSTVVIAGATPSTYNGARLITSIAPSIASSSVPVLITITRSGTTATATAVSEPHGLVNGQSVTIEGASQPEYNGTFTITYINHTQFSYTVTTVNGVTTPATGSPVSGLDVPLYFSFLGSGTAFVATYGPGNFDFLVGDSLILNGWSAFGIPDVAYTVLTSTQTGMGAGSFTFTVAGFVGTFAGIGIGGRAKRDPAFTVSSITNDGLGTATVTTSAAHGYLTGASVTISGAAQSSYNGTFPITRTGSTTFTYALVSGGVSPETPATGTITVRVITNSGSSFTFDITGAPATPATGTITATGGRNTVTGIVYMDGLFVVMDIYGVLYNSAEDDPATWNALEYITALAETGLGKAIARSGTLITAFKEYSTEFFFNAGESPGSPFRPDPTRFTQVGCASGESVADVAGRLLWIAQAKRQKGRSVYLMAGAEQVKISTPDIERILDGDDLTGVRAIGITLAGHPLYVLTLIDTGITLVYDLQSKAWGEWSSLTIGGNKTINSITRSGRIVTVTFAAPHGMADGDPLKVSGAVQTDYNGIFPVNVVSTTVATFETVATPATPATGTLVGNTYTESYFKFPKYASAAGADVVLHESDGHLYQIDATLCRDAGLPINHFARSARKDNGTLARKKQPRLAVISDSVDDIAMVRWSDDDCATFCSYRRVNLADEEPMLRQGGAFKRRTYEYRHIGNTAPTVEAFEMEITR